MFVPTQESQGDLTDEMIDERRHILYEALFCPRYRSIGFVHEGLFKLAQEFKKEIKICYGEKLYYKYMDFSISDISFQARSYQISYHSEFEIFIEKTYRDGEMPEIRKIFKTLQSISFLSQKNITWILEK